MRSVGGGWLFEAEVEVGLGIGLLLGRSWRCWQEWKEG